MKITDEARPSVGRDAGGECKRPAPRDSKVWISSAEFGLSALDDKNTTEVARRRQDGMR